MDINVDVGQNITGMLERLAAQIGTTADKVFPWYVQQAQLEGMIFLVCAAVAILLCVFAVGYGIMKGEWAHGEPDNLAAGLTIIGGACLVVSFMAALIIGPSAVTKVYNPQYHAMKMMTQDIGQMVRK